MRSRKFFSRFFSSLSQQVAIGLILSLGFVNPASAQRAGEVGIFFENDTTTPFTLERVRPAPAQNFQFYSEERKTINVKIGDEFVVKSDDPEFMHNNIFINHLNYKTIHIRPQKPLGELDQRWFQTNPGLDIEGNLRSYDLRTFDPGRVWASSVRSIFQGLDFGGSWASYRPDANTLFPVGMDYGGSPGERWRDTKNERIFGRTSFMEKWNVSAAVSIPVKAVKVKGGFGYGETKTEKRSENDVYYYTNEATNAYQITTFPENAFLEKNFVSAVRDDIGSSRDAEIFVDTWGTHYASVVRYGGRRTKYYTISEQTYLKAKETDLNITLALEKNSSVKTTDANAYKGGVGKVGRETTKDKGGDGSIGFSRSTKQEEEQITSNATGFSYAYGGSGGFGGLVVANDDAAPVGAEIRPLYELLRPEVFKNDMTAADLDQKRNWVKTVIDEIEYKCMNDPNYECNYGRVSVAPKKRGFRIRLSRVNFKEDVDDPSKEMKGQITMTVAGASSPTRTLWSSAGGWKNPREDWKKSGEWYMFEQTADANGNYAPLSLSLSGNLIDNDVSTADTCMSFWPHCDDPINFSAAELQKRIPLDGVDKLETYHFEMKGFRTHAEKTTLDIVIHVQPMPWAGNQGLNTLRRSSTRSLSSTASTTPRLVMRELSLPPSARESTSPPSARESTAVATASAADAAINWQTVDGRLKQVSADDTFVWGVNTGDAIYRRPVDGSGAWQQVAGRLKHVSASGKDWIWGVNSNNDIYKCAKPCAANGSGWQHVPGKLTQLDANDAFVLGVGQDAALYRKPVDGSGPVAWEKVPGDQFKNVAASGNSWVWGVNTGDAIFKSGSGVVPAAVAMKPPAVASAPAPAAEPVKGPNVTQVTFGDGGVTRGMFVQVGAKSWNRLNPDGSVAASFTETGRDEWSVYLKDSGGVTAMLNLWRKEVTSSSGGSTTNLGKVLSATNTPY